MHIGSVRTAYEFDIHANLGTRCSSLALIRGNRLDKTRGDGLVVSLIRCNLVAGIISYLST